MNGILVFYRFIWRFYIKFTYSLCWLFFGNIRINYIELIQNRIKNSKEWDKKRSRWALYNFSFLLQFLEIMLPIKIWNIFRFLDYTDMTRLKFNHPHLEFFYIFWWHDQMWRESSENSELKEIRQKFCVQASTPP